MVGAFVQLPPGVGECGVMASVGYRKFSCRNLLQPDLVMGQYQTQILDTFGNFLFHFCNPHFLMKFHKPTSNTVSVNKIEENLT